MANFLNTLAGYLWSMPLIILVLVTGLVFSIKLGFPQVRQFKEMLRLMKERGSSSEGLSPLQSFIFTAARTVGVGNIAGMATGIYFGGPGAIFWLWILAFFGTSIALVEGTLAQTYKKVINGEFKGGPAFYMEKGFKNKELGKLLAVIYSIVTFISLTFLMSGVQSYYIVQGLHNAFNVNTVLTGLILSAVLGIVIFGGLKRMGNTAQRISPIMGFIYVVMSIIIIILNIGKLPATIALIFKSAFGTDAVFGAIFGSAVTWGIRRGVHANEVGIGTSAVTSATATTSHPGAQGLLGGLSVYIGSLFVCTTTTFMILMTNSYNVIGADGNFVFEGVKGLDYGNPFVARAIESTIPVPGLGNIFVALAILCFAFVALTAFYLYSESNLTYLVGGNKGAIIILKICFIVSVFVGTIVASDTIWAMADIGNALMAWVNIFALIFIGNHGIRIYKDYEEQRKAGVESPIFNAKKFGIEDVEDVWGRRSI